MVSYNEYVLFTVVCISILGVEASDPVTSRIFTFTLNSRWYSVSATNDSTNSIKGITLNAAETVSFRELAIPLTFTIQTCTDVSVVARTQSSVMVSPERVSKEDAGFQR